MICNTHNNFSKSCQNSSPNMDYLHRTRTMLFDQLMEGFLLHISHTLIPTYIHGYALVYKQAVKQKEKERSLNFE